jgi:hypothetical protein
MQCPCCNETVIDSLICPSCGTGMRPMELTIWHNGIGASVWVAQPWPGPHPLRWPSGCSNCLGRANMTVKIVGDTVERGFITETRRFVETEVPYCVTCAKIEAGDQRSWFVKILIFALLALGACSFFAIEYGRVMGTAIYIPLILGLGCLFLVGYALVRVINPLKHEGAVRVFQVNNDSLDLSFTNSKYAELFMDENMALLPELPGYPIGFSKNEPTNCPEGKIRAGGIGICYERLLCA